MAKPINRTNRLDTVQPIAGTNKGVLYDQNGKGARQILCIKCKSANVSPTRGPNGEVMYACGCGARFVANKF